MSDRIHIDIAVLLDCTVSMQRYIQDALDNISLLVDKISSELGISARFALVEYRDHPPQDNTFVTRVHNFTNGAQEMKEWLYQCTAAGGGDEPEAIADALNDAFNLPWAPEATKFCILIVDAPPHGHERKGDAFPDGCPCGHDPRNIVAQMARKNIILHTVGVEPSVLPWDGYFKMLVRDTEGEYISLARVDYLANSILATVLEQPIEEHPVPELPALGAALALPPPIQAAVLALLPPPPGAALALLPPVQGAIQPRQLPAIEAAIVLPPALLPQQPNH